jgi:predicted nucleotidyltransferase
MRPRIFGSVARGEETAESDIDILVDMPGASLVDIAGLRIAAGELLGVPVDVTTPDLLKPDIRRNAERDAIPL